MGRRRAGRLVALAALIALLVLAGSPPASAHTELVRSDPTNGGMVPEGRTTLTLWFDESVGGTSTNVEVRTLGGLLVDSDFDLAESGRAMVIHTDPLERGSYVVDWHALSLVDGHAASGQVIFGSGMRPDVVATSGGSPPPELLVARWLDLAALLVAIGALSVGGRVLGAAGPAASRVRARVRRWAAYAALVACYSGLLTAFLRTRAAGAPLTGWIDETWLLLTGSTWGRLWLLRELALVVAAVALWRRPGRGTGRGRLVAAVALTAAVVIEGFAGHASGLPDGAALAAVMGAGHVLASGIWVGGLVVLAVTLLGRDGRGGPSSGVWRAYSPRAAVASAVLLATGLYQAGRHVPSVQSLDAGLYGRAVLLKVGLFLAALALAGVNTLLVNPSLAARVPWVRDRWTVPPPADATRRFVRTVALEAAVLGAAVLVAGVLTSVPTAREVAVATRPAVPHAANLDGLFVTVEAVPDGPGQRRLVVRSVPTVLPETAPTIAVDADVTGPDGVTRTVALGSRDAGRFEGAVVSDAAGSWSVSLRLHRQARPDTVVSTSWQQSATPDQLPRSLRTLTELLTLLILAALVASGLPRRRRTPPSDPARPHPTLERSAP